MPQELYDDPHENWVRIEEFPEYSVSDKGRVRSNVNGKLMAITLNQQGLPKVALSKEGEQHARSVALLVAQHHLPKPHDNNVFDTPINLDGNRLNCKVDNLMWRPRWFAIKFHKQFDEEARKGFKVPIQALSTGVIYKNSMDAAMKLGILAEDTVKSVINDKYAFPTYQKFKVLEDNNARN